MAADPEDLRRRLSAATPRDTVRGIIFNSAFALLEELAGRPAAQECDRAGKGWRTEFFSYPVADYLELAWAATERLERRLGSTDRVFWELGSRAASRWLASPLGRTLAAIAGADARRLLSNTANGYRNVVGYGTRTIEWLAERHARLTFKHDFLVPVFHCGVITTAVDAMSGTRVRAIGRETGFLESEYDVSW
jgi:uncharacterized protein (TIGR02265 family)